METFAKLFGSLLALVGPIALCVGSFLPFSVTYYLNGHSFLERELLRAGVPFRKYDNAFLWVADQKALQAAADRLSPEIIRKQFDYWTWIIGPKFSQKDEPPSISLAITPCNRWNTVATSSSDVTSPSTNGSSVSAIADCFASPPTSSPRCLAFASTEEYGASSPPFCKEWNMATTYCAPVPKMPCSACIRSSRPPAFGGSQQQLQRLWTEKSLGQPGNRSSDSSHRHRSFRSVRGPSPRCPRRLPSVPAFGSAHPFWKHENPRH